MKNVSKPAVKIQCNFMWITVLFERNAHLLNELSASL